MPGTSPMGSMSREQGLDLLMVSALPSLHCHRITDSVIAEAQSGLSLQASVLSFGEEDAAFTMAQQQKAPFDFL